MPSAVSRLLQSYLAIRIRARKVSFEAMSRQRSGGRLLLLATLLAPLALLAQTPELVVESDDITAGDLAEVMPEWSGIEPSIVLAHAPRPGVQRRVRPDEILRWARRHDMDLGRDSLPDGIVVRRRLRRLGSNETRDIVIRSAAKRFGMDPKQIEITLHGFDETPVPAGPLQFRLAGSHPRLNRPTRLSLRWENLDGRSGTLPIRATVSLHGRHAVALTGLPAGTELQATDFRFEVGPLPGPPEHYLASPQGIQGMKLRTHLRQGGVLERRMLQKVETVRRGDLIQIRIRTGLVLLQAPARAEQSGSIGDRIFCRNLDSRRRVLAIILNSKLAEVKVQP